jgi:streptogramin lyase
MGRVAPHVCLSVAIALVAWASRSTAQTVSTFVTGLTRPCGVAGGPAGQVFVCTRTPDAKVYRYTPPSPLATLVASGFVDPTDVKADALGNVYVADDGAGMVFQLPPSGPPVVLAVIANPYGLALDNAGFLYISESLNRRVDRVPTTGGIPTVYTSVLGAPTDQLGPLFVDPVGTLYAGMLTGTIFKIGPGGSPISPFATLPACTAIIPNGAGGFYAATGPDDAIDAIGSLGSPITLFAGIPGSPGHVDGGLLSAQFNGLRGMSDVGSSQDIYVAEEGNGDVRVISQLATPARSTTWGRIQALYR